MNTRFSVPDLSDSMNEALGWLIERGGQAPWSDVTRGAWRATRPTIGALIRRGLLASGPRGTVQVTQAAVTLICIYMNPHPVPVMVAAVWGQAHAHAEYRREKGIDAAADGMRAVLADVAALRDWVRGDEHLGEAGAYAALDRIEAYIRDGA